MSSDGGTRRKRRVSIASKDVLDIQPVVYSFKGPTASSHAVSVQQPPHWLYHDHVMGVIWMIFHKEKNYVGISQLQWCLRFLLDLKNSQGEYTGDVEICIQAIQDDLIEQYANLGPALDKSIRVTEKSTNATTNATRGSLEETKEDTFENEANDPVQPDLFDSIDNNTDREETYDGVFAAPQNQKITGTSTPKEEEQPPGTSGAANIGEVLEKMCGTRCAPKDGKKKRGKMLSFTYEEMLARGPAPCTEPASLIEDTYSGKLIEYSSGEKGQFGQFQDLNSSQLMNLMNTNKEETLRMLKRFMEDRLNMEALSTDLAAESSRRQENLPGDVGREAEEYKTIAD